MKLKVADREPLSAGACVSSALALLPAFRADDCLSSGPVSIAFGVVVFEALAPAYRFVEL